MAFSGSAWAEVVIGVAGPITGPNAAFGAQLQKGAEQAAADINAAGGINGEQIRIVVGDDVSDPKQGISVANKFVADGVKFVVGHFNSGVSIPASEVYAENGILEITPAATNPVFTERGLWNVFRTCGRDDQQGGIAGAYLAEKFKDAKIAVVHDKTPYGQGLADETKKAMNAAGVTEVMYEGVNVGDKDFSALIAKMKEAGVSIVYWGGLHTEAGLIIRQLADQGVKATLRLGRRHRLERARLDRRRRGCRHAEHLRPGSAPQPGEQGPGREVPRRRLRAGSLHALLLCRGAGLWPAAANAGQVARHAGSRQGHARPAPSRPCSATWPSTRRAIRSSRATSCTSGRRATTASTPTCRRCKLRPIAVEDARRETAGRFLFAASDAVLQSV